MKSTLFLQTFKKLLLKKIEADFPQIHIPQIKMTLNFQFGSNVPLLHPTKGKIIIQKDTLNECMERLYMYWKFMIRKNKGSNHTLYISNEAYLETVFINKEKQFTIRDEKGMKRKYIMKKEGVYVNKNITSIVVPRWFNMILLAQQGSSHMALGKSFENKNQVMNEYYNDLQNNLTGNHYRNNFVSVPPKAIGQ